jgi:hypothetical protein
MFSVLMSSAKAATSKVNLWELKCQCLLEEEEAEYELARNREGKHAKKLGPDAALKCLGLI